MTKTTFLEIENFSDDRGDIFVFEKSLNLPFEINRVYLIRNVPVGKERGYHAHRNLKQVLIALSGSVSVEVSDHSGTMTYKLSSPNRGLYIYGPTWRVLREFTSDCILMVLASEQFDPDDYIDNYSDFLEETKRD